MKKVIALGFFDGVHRGHAELLKETVNMAKSLGAQGVACTFDSRPEALIAHTPPALLTTPAERSRLMKELYGIEDVIIAPFDEKMRQMPWEKFVTEYLVGQHEAVGVVCGHDYRFGYLGEGTPEKLQKLCETLGLGCKVVKKVTLEGITVSSTYIRKLIEQGNMEKAVKYLGHPYVIEGEVLHGKGLGNKLGFPTLNLLLKNGKLVPAFGVYAAKVTLPDGKSYEGATNIGIRPSVADGNNITVETFLLDFQGDLYGKTVKLELFHHLRWEKHFENFQELKAEVLKNAGEVHRYFRK